MLVDDAPKFIPFKLMSRGEQENPPHCILACPALSHFCIYWLTLCHQTHYLHALAIYIHTHVCYYCYCVCLLLLLPLPPSSFFFVSFFELLHLCWVSSTRAGVVPLCVCVFVLAKQEKAFSDIHRDFIDRVFISPQTHFLLYIYTHIHTHRPRRSAPLIIIIRRRRSLKSSSSVLLVCVCCAAADLQRHT